MLPMQAMNMKHMQTILPLLFLLLLSACGTPGGFGAIPGVRSGAPAAEAPRQLTERTLPSAQTTSEQDAARSEDIAASEAENMRGYTRSESGSFYDTSPEETAETLAAPAAPTIAQDVKIALLLPLSGPHQQLGETMLQAAQMALFDMNVQNIELLPRDTKGTAAGARQAASDALNDGAQLILGPLFAPSVNAAKPLARSRRVPMVAFSTDWSLADQNTFIMGFLPFSQVQRVASYAIYQGHQRLAILAPNNPYGNAVASSYNNFAYRHQLPTADILRLPADNSEISNLLRTFTDYDARTQRREAEMESLETQLKANPNQPQLQERLRALQTESITDDLPFDAVLLAVGGDQARMVASTLSFYGMGADKVKRLGTGLWDDSSLATERSLDGAWFAAPSPEKRQAYEQRFESVYGFRPPRLTTLAYDATALAIVLARTQSQSFTAFSGVRFTPAMIANPNGFSGLDGIFRFQGNGLVERGLAVMEYRDGRIVTIDEAPRTFQTTQ